MSLRARIAAALAVAVALTIASVVLYLEFFFDPNRLKPRIVDSVRAETGRELHIIGDLSLRLFPTPLATIGTVRLFNRSPFGARPLGEIESAQFSFQLLPLLWRRLHIDELRIEGLRVAFQSQADGQDNWSDLIPARGGERASRVTVTRMHIENSELAFHDDSGAQQWFLSGLVLDTGGWGHAAATPFDMSATLASGSPALYGTVALKGETLADTQLGRYTARKLKLNFNGRGTGEPIEAELGGRVVFDRTTGTVQAVAAATLLDLKLKAQLEARDISGEMSFDGRLAVAEFNPRRLLQQLGREVPDTRDASALTTADLKMRVHGDASRTIVAPIDARLDASKLTGYVTVANYARPQVDFRLTVNRLDFDRYRSPVPGPISLENALTAVSRDGLRDLGYAVTGEINIGVMILAQARGDDYRTVVHAGPPT